MKKWAEATMIGPAQKPHDYSVNNIVQEIEQSVAKAGLRFINHLEILKRAPETAQKAPSPLSLPVKHIEFNFRKGGLKSKVNFSIRPDAVFGIEYPNNQVRFFALERDMNTETYIPQHGFSDTSWLEKTLAYDALADGQLMKYLGIPRLHVLGIMQTDRCVNNFLAKLATIPLKHPELFGFCTARQHTRMKFPYTLPDYYLTAEMKRHGLPPLKLGTVEGA
jgi:hypothetical protein